MNAVAILAHLMDRSGRLDEESIARIKAAVDLDETLQFDLFFTTGWDYRSDSKVKIGDVIASYLTVIYGIDTHRIYTDTWARDTVGDAFFLRQNLVRPFAVKQLTIVTSDYHVRRADTIFKRFLSPDVSIDTVGANIESLDRGQLDRYEDASLNAFTETFMGVDLSSDDEVLHTLQVKHPFYNGNVYSRI